MEQSKNGKGVALIGMTGRFPGAASVEEFWQNLMEGKEAISVASDKDLLAAGVSPALLANPNYVRATSTISEPEYFDASFFGFSAREAEIIDPQHRVFLECAWEALEDAACDASIYPGAIGVFAGTGMNSYGAFNLMSRPDIVAAVGSYQAILGNDKDFLCSRVAYKLNLRGPAIGVQTACSTSLVAVQMAFESLLREECDMALAGGVSIPLPQGTGYLYVPGMILSRDGHCRAFDASSSGTVPGAGAGVVVLKRLKDALEDNDHIYAVIQGAAINNDGAAKVGYSAPSVNGQQAVIRKSMEMAGFDPASVKYIEAHGTGTEVGDPIEFTALARVFESAADATGTCALGALKTNLGHLDTAAGVAGLMKAALSVERRTIPPTLHFIQANPLIDFAKSPFYVNTRPVSYDSKEPFRAGVSSFGIGGTNAHVSLEEAPVRASDPAEGPQLIVLSAKTADGLNRRMSQLLQYAEETPNANLADIAFTLQVGRQSFQFRQALVTRNSEHLKEQLKAGSQSGGLKRLRNEDALPDAPSVAFLFPGQGTQFVNMGQDLYQGIPLFRETVDHCAQILQPCLGLDLRTVLYPREGEEKEAERLLNQTYITQPALFTIEYAMSRLWMQCGVSPSAMVGHSVGEYVAACLAGVFSLDDALKLIAERGRLIQSMPAGVMLAVSLSEHDLSPLLSSSVSIAAINSENQAVASGPEQEIAALEESLNRKKIPCKRLRTSHAFHSPMMEPIVDAFVERVGKVKRNAPGIRYLSNVTGNWITAEQATDPAYWGAHLRNGVRFADCARRLLSDANGVLLEVGPGETLGALIRIQSGQNGKPTIIPSMRHALTQANDREVWLQAIAKLWLKNARIDWKGLHTGEKRMRVPLPTYPFSRQRYWVEPGNLSVAIATEELPQKKADIADWFYVPSWKRTMASLTPVPAGMANWLLFTNDDALSQTLEKKLEAQGTVVCVRAGDRFGALSANTYEVRAGSEDDARALMRELAARQLWPHRIAYLWKPDLPDCGALAAMALVQAIEEENPAAPVDLNVIGDRAYSVFGEQISSPALAAQHAFWRTVPIECPNLRLRIMDVDLNLNGETAGEQIVRELQRSIVQETIAYRGTERWQQIYEPIRIEKADAEGFSSGLDLRSAGTYVITGGLGGVGLVLARHIAEKTHGQILLISRTALPPKNEWDSLLAHPETEKALKEKLNGVRAIEHAGGQAETMHVDVSDATAMKSLMAAIRSRYGAVHGIIHAAGVAGSGLIQTKSPAQALSTLSSKVQGTEWLQDELKASGLDFVMLCSSINAVLPYFGLSDYAAANAYLDAFAAAHDNPQGTRVLSVNWDTWREVGMAVNTPPPSAREPVEDRLKHAIRSEEAAEVFDRLLQLPLSQTVVSTRDLPALLRMTSAAIEASAINHETRADLPGAELEANADSSVADDDIEGFVVRLWQEVLGIEPIGLHDNFFQLGGHSLMGTQVLARVRERFRINLPLRSVFEAATPAELAQRIRVMHWAMNPAESSQADADVEREEIEI